MLDTLGLSRSATSLAQGVWQRLVLIVLMLLSVVATAEAQLELGSISFARPPARALTRVMSVAPGFYFNVGGVAFSGVAELEDDLVVEGLWYDVERADGQRLVVALSDAQGRRLEAWGDLHDWQLVPIARLADSDFHACVTLFGDLEDDGEQDSAESQGNRIINYHPALEDTLLGLRLLQADMLVFVPDAADLFKQDGQYLLGAGESAPSVAEVKRSRRNFRTVESWLQAQEEEFSSYVVGGRGQRVAFSVVEGQLVFSGDPSWDCWRYSDRYSDHQEWIILTIEVEYATDVEALGEFGADLKWTDKYIDARYAELADGENAPTEEERIQSLPVLSEGLSQRVKKSKGINATVYRSLRLTMGYSALFRHFKATDPQGFKEFLKALESVEVLPRIETPSVMNSQ